MKIFSPYNKKNFIKIISIAILMYLLTACQNTLIQSDGAYYQISSDASIEITRELSVPANSARAYLQNGELLRHTGINLYNTSCEVLINTVSESRQTISPGIFTILSIEQNESPIVMSQTIQVAALDFSYQQYARGGGSGSGSPVDIKRYYRFKLAAQDQEKQLTQVRSITCRGSQDEPYKARLPTFNEMQAAVGSYVKFNFKLM